MNYQLNLNQWSGMFAVPNCAMEYIREASGNTIKVLLAILHSPSQKPTPEEIASTLSLSLEEVKDGIRYWIEKEVLTAVTPEQQPIVKISKPSATSISSKELAEQRMNNEKVRSLFETTEQIYGRPLNTTERKTLLYIYQSTLLPVDVILMIIEYCIRIDRQSIQYIMRVCQDWADQEINTHEKVEEQIRIQLEKDKGQKLICSCFGIRRKLSKKEERYVEKWLNQYQFNINMIRLAYERCVDSISELSFPYINEILTRWHKNKITTPEEATTYDSKVKSQNQEDSSSPSYDLDELAKRGMFIPEL